MDNIVNIDNITKPKATRKYVMTDKRKEAIERMKKARAEQLALKRAAKSTITKPEERESFLREPKEKSKESSESSETDSDNYESDENTKPVIISNYDKDEPETKIKITKVRRRTKSLALMVDDRLSNNELKKIYDEVKLEESIIPKKKQSNRRAKILDAYYERNKDNFTSHDGELEEFEFSQEEWDNIHTRFIAYEKDQLKNVIKKASPKKRIKKSSK